MTHSVMCPCNSVGVNENCGLCFGTGWITQQITLPRTAKVQPPDPRPLIAKFGSLKARAEQEAWRRSREKICEKCNRHLQPEDYSAHMAQIHPERAIERPSGYAGEPQMAPHEPRPTAVRRDRPKHESRMSNLITYDDFSHLPSAAPRDSSGVRPRPAAGKSDILFDHWSKARNDSRHLQANDRMDANLGMGFFARENGKYGSHPIHDSFDDDSKP